LHQLGIVHGDVRPGQLLMESNGNIKLLIDPAQIPGPINVAQLDPNSPAAAKADYLAPEFLQANKIPDVRTDIYALGSYWTLGGKPWESDPSMVQRRMGHACEFETSMMLRLHPHLVAGDVKQLKDVDWGNPFEPASRGWITKDRTEPGHIGFPRHATAEKGEILFRTFAADVVALMERVIKWDGKSWDG
jgi:serine/threonine protein kinase